MVKTRFAPSPTGSLHIGGLRTALYAYLYARHNNGSFILRIEDTDQNREVEGATKHIIQILQHFGLQHDEGPTLTESEKGPNGPYVQSKRTDLYRKYAQQLLDNGHAYRCFCTKERLEEMREHQTKNKLAPMYDRRCLDLPQSELEQKLKDNIPFVIRQKIPYQEIKFHDIIRGTTRFHGKTIDDQILMKSDNFPTYHLANVVDDHFMEITHVTRAEEWISSTPKHLFLYQAFGWEPPEYAHLPLLLNEDRSKLSKRQGDVAVESYIEKGYSVESILNFIVFMGWHPGAGEEREIFTLKELEEAFTLEKVHKSGAIFNLEKLDWFNWKWKKENHHKKLLEIAKQIDPNVTISSPRKEQHIFTFQDPQLENSFNQMRGNEILKHCEGFLSPKHKDNSDKLTNALITVEEKILRSPNEVTDYIDFYFTLPQYPKELLTHEKMGVDSNQALDSLKACLEALENCPWTLEEITKALMNKIQEINVKNGQLLWPLRSALSGLQFSPGAFEIAFVLGKEETINRIQQAITKL
ncbi:glutamate--tRNA ligase [Candidatus Peregrinibacteria bacterium HGW-Peregrinibacteria-1]|jgi:glutamyl-tRNA synthetase|nr:MAG: glutamate--tRNA ligase [Candidatus Peregrinibacteria bacterium HGW-Peregrinibacteria-1]